MMVEIGTKYVSENLKIHILILIFRRGDSIVFIPYLDDSPHPMFLILHYYSMPSHWLYRTCPLIWQSVLHLGCTTRGGSKRHHQRVPCQYHRVGDGERVSNGVIHHLNTGVIAASLLHLPVGSHCIHCRRRAFQCSTIHYNTTRW